MTRLTETLTETLTERRLEKVLKIETFREDSLSEFH